MRNTRSSKLTDAPSLVVPREEVIRRIGDQIERGRELRERPLAAVAAVGTAETERRMWREFNTELLRQVFSNSSIAEEFSKEYPTSSGYAVGQIGGAPKARPQPTIEARVNSFRARLMWDLQKLESIHARLVVIRESPTVARQLANSQHDTPQRSGDFDNGAPGGTENHMARRVNQQKAEPLPDPSLKVSREEAQEKIAIQIEQGKRLAARSISDDSEMSRAWADERKWVEFTTTLLNKLFDNAKLADEFKDAARWHGAFGGPDGFPAKSAHFSQGVNYHVDKLESIIERLPLVEEPFGLQVAKELAEGAHLHGGQQPASPPALQVPQQYSQPRAVGSPFGFREDDWELVEKQRRDTNKLYVVLGYQWKSEHYDSKQLERNIQHHFSDAVQFRNESADTPITLVFEPLALGLGEHVFNHIARKIIGADVAVFETSDLNPNVFLELGVALTWGVAVIPIKHHGCPPPPSDISGQSWVDHEESGLKITSEERFDRKLMQMISRIIATKRGRK
jgi:hypothetical protein